MKHVHRTLLALAAGTALLGGSLAASAAELQLSPEHHEGKVAYRSGGIGKDEAAAFEHAAAHYPLTLEFVEKTRPRAEFLSDVHVRIQDQHGHTVLSTTAEGPFLLVQLPHGGYKVSASHDGKSEERMVKVDRMDHRRIMFEWTA